MENNLLKTNQFKIVGKLLSADIRTGNRKDNGQGYVSVNAVIGSTINGKSCEYEVAFFANQLTQDGKESKLYTSYCKLNELVNKKVQVTGDIRENRFWSERNGVMSSKQELSGRFVNGVVDSTMDEATYELGGFIVKSLIEKRNKNDEVYRYDVTIGQSNYSGNGMSMYTLHINPNDHDIVRGLEDYEVGSTLVIGGNLSFTVETVTRAMDNMGGFGDAPMKTFTNKQRNFFVTYGSEPITEVEKGCYESSVIKTLIEAYKAHDVELMNKSVKSEAVAPVVKEAPVTRRQTSLI